MHSVSFRAHVVTSSCHRTACICLASCVDTVRIVGYVAQSLYETVRSLSVRPSVRLTIVCALRCESHVRASAWFKLYFLSVLLISSSDDRFSSCHRSSV